MRFVKFAVREYTGTEEYVAFGEVEDQLPVYQVTSAGLDPIGTGSVEDGDFVPTMYPAIMKLIEPVRLSREGRLSAREIERRYGKILTEEMKDTVRCRT